MELKLRGHPVRATTGGRPLDTSLPLIVFLHGASQDRTLWALQQRYFSHHGWSVLAPDFPGHGLSGGALLGTIEEMAEWTAELIGEAGFAAMAVVGHSMGALVGLELAGTRRDLVTKLVLSGTGAALPVGDHLQAPADENERRAHEMILGWSLAPRSAKGGHPTPGLWMSGQVLHTSLNNDDDEAVLATGLRACNTYDRGLMMAAAIKCPTLVLAGESDHMINRESMEDLLEALGDNGATIDVEDAGHALMVEQPDAVLDALIEFLA